MASTVNVMTSHVSRKMMSCVLDMALVNVGNVSVRQIGLVRPATVWFLQRSVKLMTGMHCALVMVTASVVLATAMKIIWENIVKIRLFK
jgi:hypothetical protein